MRRNYTLSQEAIERYNAFAIQNNIRQIPLTPPHKQVYTFYLSDLAYSFLLKQATQFKTLNQRGEPSPSHYIELLAEVDDETDHSFQSTTDA
jgi:hypothetical protein